MDISQRNQITSWIVETLKTLNMSQLENKLHVEFNEKFTRKMGDAHRDRITGEIRVRFSVPLWALATEVQRKECVVHEVCHIVDMVQGSFRQSEAHGFSWARLMRRCGMEPNRCHTVKRPQELKNNVQRWEAKCACKVHTITTHRRTKMLNGFHYKCLSCNQRISLAN